MSGHSPQAEQQRQQASQIEVTYRSRSEQTEAAIKVFELSQGLQENWFAADYAANRQILWSVFLNFP